MLHFKDPFWQSIVNQLRAPIPDDPLNECYHDGFDKLVDRADDLTSLANKNLHTFPFKDVKPCWFRLYTDASISKALKLIKDDWFLDEPSLLSESEQVQLDEIVSLLDMSLIMAGGLGREDMIHQMLEKLACIAKGDETVKRPSKKQRVRVSDMNGMPTAVKSLPDHDVSVPVPRFPVSRMHRPSMAEFSKFMRDEKSPVLLTGILDHWPALESWKQTLYWLEQTMGGRRLVPIEVGRSYTDDDWGQKIVPFREFLSQYILPRSANGAACEDMKTGYLAQHDLFRQIPALHKDIATPDYCFLDAPPAEPGTPVYLSKLKKGPGGDTSHPTTLPSLSCSGDNGHDGTSNEAEGDTEVHTNIWFGPPWTISPLHHDPYHNILCQVVGKKYIRLYSPTHSKALYPKSEAEPAPHTFGKPASDAREDVSQSTQGPHTIDMSNTSQIDVAAMEMSPHEDWDDVYPGISKVSYKECVLEAGQALYIPIGWWHYVRSCSVGISVSFWW
ncbi:hypothetical protein ABEF95_007368 [Exophiala dermatitidis]